MKPRQDHPRLASRASLVVGVGALVAVAMAARSGGQQPTPPPEPPSAASAMARADTTPIPDSMANAMATSDSAMVMPATAAVSPAPTPTGTWPVDPVTGQPIINGERAVGRVVFGQVKALFDGCFVVAREAAASLQVDVAGKGVFVKRSLIEQVAGVEQIGAGVDQPQAR